MSRRSDIVSVVVQVVCISIIAICGSCLLLGCQMHLHYHAPIKQISAQDKMQNKMLDDALEELSNVETDED